MDVDDATAAPAQPSAVARSRRPVGRTRSRGRGAPGARRIRPLGRVLGGTGDVPAPAGRRPTASPDRRPVWRPGRDHLHVLAALVGAGVRVDAAFEALAAAAATSTTHRAAAQVAHHVRSGGPLAKVLDDLGAPAHVVALISGGERSGRIGDALRSAGDLVGQIEGLRTTVRRALLYPGLILVIGVAMTTVIVVAVVPMLERTFIDLGGQLPLPTRIVIEGGRALRGPWLLVALTVSILLVRPVSRLGAGRRVAAAMRRRMPIVRSLDADLDVAVLATMLATMLRAGVSLDEALTTCLTTARVGTGRSAVEGAIVAVRSGGSAFSEDGLGAVLTRSEREMLAVAEEGGFLADQLQRVAQLRHEALERRSVRLGTTLEPALVLLVGLVVGGVVLALYLPTFRVLDLL